jgi:phospholipid transport system substrate-binding protein
MKARSHVLFRFSLRSTLALLVFGTVPLLHAAPADDAMTMLRHSVDEVLSIAYSGSENQTLPRRVRPALEKSVAFDLVTRQAMGPGWRQFSPADQKRVTDLFSELLIRTYSARVVGTQRPKIVFGSPVALGSDRFEVPTRVTTSASNEPVAVGYRLVKLTTGWRIYDLLIEGVSFVANYREQFDQIIQRGGAAAAIRSLEAKLAAPVAPHS